MIRLLLTVRQWLRFVASLPIGVDRSTDAILLVDCVCMLLFITFFYIGCLLYGFHHWLVWSSILWWRGCNRLLAVGGWAVTRQFRWCLFAFWFWVLSFGLILFDLIWFDLINFFFDFVSFIKFDLVWLILLNSLYIIYI